MRKSLLLAAASLVLVVPLTGCAAAQNDGQAAQAADTSISPAPLSGSAEDQATELFDDWNASLATGDPEAVNEMYADDAVLLPTLAAGVRQTDEERVDYFGGFLAGDPSGVIDEMVVRQTGPESLVSSGLYTFTMGETGDVVPARFTYVYEYDGEQWLIVSHHSSRVPGAE